jgi:hypothetical protein
MILLEALVESIADPVFVKPPQNIALFGVLGLAYAGTKRRHRRDQ